MKTTTEIYMQEQRIISLLHTVKTHFAKQADQNTGGNEMLVNNWGNNEAKAIVDRYNKRRSKIYAIISEKYFEAFKKEHPDHLNSVNNNNVFYKY